VRRETNSTSRTGGADFQVDAVIVSGTNSKESICVAGEAFGASVLGLAAQVNITWARPGLDRLTVNALAGDDVVAASGLSADAIQFAADGGAGGDVRTGSPGPRRGFTPGFGFDPCVNGGFFDPHLNRGCFDRFEDRYDHRFRFRGLDPRFDPRVNGGFCAPRLIPGF
jgi:hypothetical protein